jgi:hypothetical protein
MGSGDSSSGIHVSALLGSLSARENFFLLLLNYCILFCAFDPLRIVTVLVLIGLIVLVLIGLWVVSPRRREGRRECFVSFDK